MNVTLLPGAQELLAVHARELPQRDDLCGAFCGTLALHAAGIEEFDGETVDQDAVAVAAATVVSAVRDDANLPLDERGRRDYRVPPRLIDDGRRRARRRAAWPAPSSSSPPGRSRHSPTAGPWPTGALAGLFELAAGLSARHVVANLATGHLWGAGADAARCLRVCSTARDRASQRLGGRPLRLPDWPVRGPGGSLYAVADTYPSLGSEGIHLQPQERLAVALRAAGDGAGRPDRRRRRRRDAAAVRSRAGAPRPERGRLGQRHGHAGDAA